MATEVELGASPVILPRPRRLALHNFSLYSRTRTIEVEFDREVFCLAGANGLGKSTFLAALTYAMTGAVARPGLNFLGASDYYSDVKDYSARFFDGRIDAADHEIASVELEMSIGDQTIELRRGMFDPEGLRELRITGPNGQDDDLSGPDITDAERHRRYVEVICEKTQVVDFAQLVFLQLVVLTFDEQRRLLFWSPRVTEQALFLAFGVSAEAATRAEALQRTYDSAESRARNLQWQATGRRQRLNALRSAAGSAEIEAPAEVRGEHKRLTEALDSAGADLDEAESALREAEVRLDDATARRTAAQEQYEGAYRDVLGQSRAAHLHPAVRRAIDDEHCDVCGATGESVATAVSGPLAEGRCPLCASPIESASDEEIAAAQARLRELGDELVSAQEVESTAHTDLGRRHESVVQAEARVRELSRGLEEFRRANNEALLQASGEEGLLEQASRGLQEEINDLLREKNEELERRNAAQASLNDLRDELAGRFVEMEDEFVPLLQALAHEFLGVPLQVELERRGAHISLGLSFDGSERRTPEALSESQRFFMDIALRMALARRFAAAGGAATLFVDTPEGSLDIAYESRAGKMFGAFALASNGARNQLIMTANINTSRLLQELAAVCGRDHMELIRMTDWTELSDVQQEAQELFEQAYASIEDQLESSHA